jgi:hypothetical protein
MLRELPLSPPSDKGEAAPSGRCCRGGPEEAGAGTRWDRTQPPTDSQSRGAADAPTQYDRALAAIGRLRDALATGVPSRAAMKAAGKALARTATILRRWLERRVDKAGIATAMVGYAFGAHVELGVLLQMIVLAQVIGHRSSRD